MRRSGTVLAATTLVLVAGCGSHGHEPVGGPEQSTASPTLARTVTPQPVPAGWKRLVAKKAGLAFAVPRSWTVIDAATIMDRRHAAAYKLLAKSQHITVAEVRLKVSRVELSVESPRSTTAGRLRVTAELMKGETTIPTAARLRRSFERLNFEVDRIVDIQTPLGAGRLLSGTYLLPNGSKLYAQSLYLTVRNGIADLGVSASSESRASSLMDALAATLQDVG